MFLQLRCHLAAIDEQGRASDVPPGRMPGIRMQALPPPGEPPLPERDVAEGVAQELGSKVALGQAVRINRGIPR